MTYKDYVTELNTMFAKYGFSDNPLVQVELKICYRHGATLDQAYKIGCDCYAGIDFLEAWIANIN